VDSKPKKKKKLRGREAGVGGGAFAAGCLNAYLAAALSRVVRAAMPIPVLLLLLLLCCILLLLVGLTQVLWGPSRHLGSLTAANWGSFDFNVSCSSC